MPSDEHRIIIRTDRTSADDRARRFDTPPVEKVAKVMIESEYSRCDIVIQRRDQHLIRIDAMHPSYDALQYPISFRMGNDTYH